MLKQNGLSSTKPGLGLEKATSFKLATTKGQRDYVTTGNLTLVPVFKSQTLQVKKVA